MNGLIWLSSNGLPPGYCYPGDPDQFVADMLNSVVVNFNTSTGNFYYNIGDTEPSVDNRVYPWFRTGSADGYDGWYYWSDTYSGWAKPHDIPASSDIRMLWVGTDVELETFDGGSAGVATPSTGPFWEIDTDFAARVPMGPGTTAGGTAITVGVNAGADTVTLVDANVPEHRHFVCNTDHVTSAEPLVNAANQVLRSVDNAGDEEYALMGTSTEATVGRTSAFGSATPTAVDIVNPVRGCYIIKRTARVYRII